MKNGRTRAFLPAPLHILPCRQTAFPAGTNRRSRHASHGHDIRHGLSGHAECLLPEGLGFHPYFFKKISWLHDNQCRRKDKSPCRSGLLPMACPQKRTRAGRDGSLPARFQHCAGQTPVCPAVRFFVFRMLEDAAEVGHVKHDHGQQTAEYAQRQARLGHVAGCYHAGGIGKGIGRITDGQTHAQ